jgi:hypothetical protein
LHAGSFDERVTLSAGTNYADFFGYDMTAIDWDGDGDLELFIGAKYTNGAEWGTGALYLYDDVL